MFFFFNFIWVLYLIYGNELKKKKYFSLKMYKRRNFFLEWVERIGEYKVKSRLSNDKVIFNIDMLY